jgi:phosphoribosylamine-glycine ligase
MEDAGCRVFFASAEQTAKTSYRTVGTSRAVALATSGPTLEQARARVARCAGWVHPLEWRHDVGDESYLCGLSKLVGQAPAPERSLLPNKS